MERQITKITVLVLVGIICLSVYYPYAEHRQSAVYRLPPAVTDPADRETVEPVANANVRPLRAPRPVSSQATSPPSRFWDTRLAKGLTGGATHPSGSVGRLNAVAQAPTLEPIWELPAMDLIEDRGFGDLQTAIAVRKDQPTPANALTSPVPSVSLYRRFTQQNNRRHQDPQRPAEVTPAEDHAQIDWTPELTLSPSFLQKFRQQIPSSGKLDGGKTISSAFRSTQNALAMISQSLDQSTGTRRFSTALGSAVVALDESEDFSVEQPALGRMVSIHDTPVLKNQKAAEVNRREAQLAYLTYAEQQFLKACGKQPVASEAFRLMGQLYLAAELFDEPHHESPAAKSMIMFRLALAVQPDDAVSSHHLGMIYARFHHYQQARGLLIDSLKIRNDALTWNVLAKVHQALGENQLAQLAKQEGRLLPPSVHLQDRIESVAVHQFNRIQPLSRQGLWMAQPTGVQFEPTNPRR